MQITKNIIVHQRPSALAAKPVLACVDKPELKFSYLSKLCNFKCLDTLNFMGKSMYRLCEYFMLDFIV